jgi:AcrR family transcriptional regulator
MTDTGERKTPDTRLQMLQAASRQFAVKPYSQVSLDDILADAEVTKGALYFHFRSKHALAVAIVEHRSRASRDELRQLLDNRLSALETLIDMAFLIAIDDLSDVMTRAGFNLLESVGRADGLQAKVVGTWVTGYRQLVRRAIEEGDVRRGTDPEAVARLMVATYLGHRQASDLEKPEQFLTDLQSSWSMLLAGFADTDRVRYLNQFLRRRTLHAVKRVTPLRLDVL